MDPTSGKKLFRHPGQLLLQVQVSNFIGHLRLKQYIKTCDCSTKLLGNWSILSAVGCSIRVSMVCALQLCDIKAAGGFVSREEHNGRVIEKSCFPRQQAFGPGDPFEGFVLWSFRLRCKSLGLRARCSGHPVLSRE